MEDLLEPLEKPVNKPRLFLLHTAATFFLGFFGGSLASVVFLPFDADDPFIIEATQRYIKLFPYFVGAFLLAGTVISIIICRKYGIGIILPLGVAVFAAILYIFLERFEAPYLAYALPGTYIKAHSGLIPAVILNMIYLLSIPAFLFYQTLLPRDRPKRNTLQR